MKFLLSFILCCLCIFSDAQIANTHISFLGIPLNGTVEDFSLRIEERGFNIVKERESSIIFAGTFANELVKLELIFSPKTKTVCKITIDFPEKDIWSQLRSDYLEKKSLYQSKYFLSDEYEFFSYPYEEGDGYEMRAIVQEKCRFISFYSTVGGRIWVEICKNCCIRITYEDTINIHIAKEELKYNAFDNF